MKWKLIDKTGTSRPTRGGYRDWKSTLAKEGGYQCVYCCIGENRFGGIRNFHVEHWKPQSKFEELTNDFDNLFYACGICNVLKSDDWPRDPTSDFNHAYYPAPSAIDYSSFLTTVHETGHVDSATLTGKYIIERLHLNRPQLITARRTHAIVEELKKLKDQLVELTPVAGDEIRRLIVLIGNLFDMLYKIWHARPYTRADEKVQVPV